MSSQVLNCHQARWAMFLSDFDFHLTWGPGHNNVMDAPSWYLDFIPQKEDEQLEAQHQVLLTKTHTKHLFPFNSDSSSVLSLSSLYAFTTLSIDNSELLHCFKHAFQEDLEWHKAIIGGDLDFKTEGGLVFHAGRFYVPPSLHAGMLMTRYDSVIGGHPGQNCTLNLVSCDYSWPRMNTYVCCYVEVCDTCPCIKAPNHKPYGLLQPLDIPSCPWQSISMDFIVKLPCFSWVWFHLGCL